MTWRLAPALAVCLAAALSYLSAVHAYFVNDDFGVVHLLSQKPLFYFPRWFVTSWMDSIWGFTPDEVRPFTALSYQLAALFGPGSPVPQHVLNIAIHALNGVLVLLLSRRVAGLGPFPATVAAVLFVLFPIHAESVAWITGRVDSLPAFFYVASFLAYVGWRRGAARSGWLYASSLALFFCALFSKQNTISMVATLVLYDVLVESRAVRVSWSWARPYVPFAALTAGYVLLRHALFGEFAQGSWLASGRLAWFPVQVGNHFQRLILGAELGAWPLGYVAAAVAVAGAWLLARTAGARELRRAPALVLYFGPVWWAIGMSPILVAGYDSTRHVYLASFGWAVVLGLALHALWHAPRSAWRYAGAVLCAALAVVYIREQQREIATWNSRARVSETMAVAVQREALAAPEGTLLLLSPPRHEWVWALPFAVQPPMAQADFRARVFMVWPMVSHCCHLQWHKDTRRKLLAWAARGDDAPVVALLWDPRARTVSRVTEREDPTLRSQTLGVLQVKPVEMEEAFRRVLKKVGLSR